MFEGRVTIEMIEHWLGSDTDIPDLLSELANGDFKPEEFRDDIIDAWENWVGDD